MNNIAEKVLHNLDDPNAPEFEQWGMIPQFIRREIRALCNAAMAAVIARGDLANALAKERGKVANLKERLAEKEQCINSYVSHCEMLYREKHAAIKEARRSALEELQGYVTRYYRGLGGTISALSPEVYISEKIKDLTGDDI